MGIETVVVIVIAVIVLSIFGAKKKKNRNSGTTRIIIVKDGEDVEIDGGARSVSGGASGLKKTLTMLVSLAAGFAAAGFVIVQFIEPDMGPVDPWEPLALVLYGIFAAIIYAVIRGLSRD